MKHLVALICHPIMVSFESVCHLILVQRLFSNPSLVMSLKPYFPKFLLVYLHLLLMFLFLKASHFDFPMFYLLFDYFDLPLLSLFGRHCHHHFTFKLLSMS